MFSTRTVFRINILEDVRGGVLPPLWTTFNELGFELLNLGKAASNKTIEITLFFESKVWPSLKETSFVINNSIRMIAIHIKAHSELLTSIVDKIRLVAAIAFVFAIKSTCIEFINLINNFILHDVEGTILSIISAISSIGNAINSFITTLSSLELGYGLNFNEVNNFFKPYATPLYLLLLAHSVMNTVYHTIFYAIEISQLPSEVDEKDIISLQLLLKDKLGATEDEKKNIKQKFENLVSLEKNALIKKEICILKNRKINILQRDIDVKVVNIMRDIKKNMKSITDIPTINLALMDIRAIAYRKIISNTAKAIMNAAQFFAIAASNYFGAAPLVSPIVGTIRAIVNLICEHYQSNRPLSYTYQERTVFFEPPIRA